MVTRAWGPSALLIVPLRCHNECMKRRKYLFLGLAIGYVLGAKAGRERYEQIRKIAIGIAENPPIRQFLDEMKDLSESGSDAARAKLGDHLRDASTLIREKIEEGNA